MPRINDYIHESNRIEGFNDPEVDKISVAAWRYFNDTARERKHKGMFPITHQLIQETQKRLVSHQNDLNEQWRGVYRDRSNTRVTVGGVEAMKPQHVGVAMDDWLDHLPEFSAEQNHVKFEHIHPFADGNGRTGRFLMWWQQKYMEDRPMTYIDFYHRNQYYKWFEDEETNYAL